jgi:hypothetical protein
MTESYEAATASAVVSRSSHSSSSSSASSTKCNGGVAFDLENDRVLPFLFRFSLLLAGFVSSAFL